MGTHMRRVAVKVEILRQSVNTGPYHDDGFI
jgi:hypothetical protein